MFITLWPHWTTKVKSSSTSFMKVSCTVHKNGFHSPLNRSIFWMQALTKHWRWPPPKIFFFVFLSFNRRVTVIDPRWPPTGSVSGVCGDALVVKRKCSVSLFYSVWCETPTSLNSDRRGSCLILQPALRVPGVLGCIAQSVFTCGSWGAWCLTYWTWRWRAALHILTCKHANVQGLLNQPQC